MARNDPTRLHRVARSLYRGGNVGMVALQVLRPFICPFGDLIDLVPPGARVLDVGCGGGLFLGLLAARQPIAQGLGFDVSPAAIEIAQRMKRTHRRGNTLQFERRPAGGRWPTGTFDVVSMIDVMHHIPLPLRRDMIQEACDHVGAGGMLLYKDIANRPRWRATANVVHDLLVAGEWTRVQNFGQVERWCGEFGLALERTWCRNVLWYGHEIGVFRKASR